MSALKTLFTIAVMGGSAYLAYTHRDKILELIQTIKKSRCKNPQIPEKPHAAIDEVCTAFLTYADRFEGLYEPLYKASLSSISQERMGNVLNEWRIRISSIGESIPSCLKSWWISVAEEQGLSLQERAQKIIGMVFSCRIVRDGRKEFTAQEDITRFYQEADGKPLGKGVRLRVVSPCWYVSGDPVRILEKGFCEIL